MKRTVILALILIFATCEKDRSPIKPTGTNTGIIKIAIEGKSETKKGNSDSLYIISKVADPVRLSQLEVRVLKSDNSVLASKTSTPSNGFFNVSMTVEALNDLKVLCIGTINGVVEYFGIDEDVDVKPGKTTTAVINGWNSRYIPDITSIAPNPSTDGSYAVLWNNVPNATIYVLQEADNQGLSVIGTVYSGSEPMRGFSGMVYGTYYYRVQASNTYGITSGWSNIASVTVNKPEYTISGTIIGADDVIVTLSGNTSDSQTVNDGDSYSFTVTEGGNYTVTPSKSGYTFTPLSKTFTNVTSDLTQNFTATQKTHTISGTVTGANSVTVELSGDDTDTQFADEVGNFSFTVEHGGNYTLTPSKTDYTFTPESQSFDNVTTDIFTNFTASYSPITYIISGTITGANGVLITLSDDTSDTQTVNDGGSYSFTVEHGGSYTVTPSKDGYIFTPISKAFINVTSDQTQNFSGEEIPPVMYILTIGVNQSGWGTTTPTIGTYTYDEDTIVNIIATPSEGYQFMNWTGEVDNTNNASTSVTINSNTTITANFEEIPQEPIEITMVSVPAGTFEMGDRVGDLSWWCRPVHTVTLEAFKMSATEITQEQYEAIIGWNPSWYSGSDDLPVEYVTWYDAVKFCNFLSDETGLERCYDEDTWECDFSKNGYRLPTEAEWEYACRSGTKTLFYTGNTENDLDRAGWYFHNADNNTHPVGQKEPNSWGLYDMHGNVWEWCNDWFDKGYYSNEDAYNPTGPQDGDWHVMRGGSVGHYANSCRIAYRGSFMGVEGRSYTLGFRVVSREY